MDFKNSELSINDYAAKNEISNSEALILLNAGKKLCDETGFTQIEIPGDYGVKDPSDFIEKFGKNKLKKLVLRLIKQ